jgi:hypothetical protein
MSEETFRLDVAAEGGPIVWIGDKSYKVVQHEVCDIKYGQGIVLRRRRAYIDLDSRWSLGLLWSDGSLSCNATDRVAARGGAFAEEPHCVEVAALQYGALVAGQTMPFAEPALARAIASELEMTHEDGPAPMWTRGGLDDG